MSEQCKHHWEPLGHYVHPKNVVLKCSVCSTVRVRTYKPETDTFEWIPLSDIDLSASLRPEDTELSYLEMKELQSIQPETT